MYILYVCCRYEAVYAKKIPADITGESFLKTYTDHDDTVTVIVPKRTYAVKAPTKHPIYENFRVEVGPYLYIFGYLISKLVFRNS